MTKHNNGRNSFQCFIFEICVDVSKDDNDVCVVVVLETGTNKFNRFLPRRFKTFSGIQA